MEGLVGAVVDALMLSSIYILVSLGFALILSIIGILNFAHGALYMIGGYICYWLSTQLGLNQWLSLLMAAIILGLIGLFLERFCFRPFVGDANRTIIMAIALILILETTINVLAGGVTRTISSFVPGILKAGAVSVSLERVATFFMAGILLLILTLFIGKTRAGQQMLAVSQEPEGAILQGIRIHRISALAVVMSCALAAVAGSFMGAIFDLKPFMGGPMLVKAIQVVVLSGIGNIGGILAGGLIIGTLDAILPLLADGAVTQAVGLGIIIVLLLFKPQGLFGREVA
ncbi:MAG: branched-chain amino acid ABC transporter permease [Deltaproteobacteria bacterium]|nr:branched-chain amino acid ABC transporter permease [Deltaproteobacteria bacterium]